MIDLLLSLIKYTAIFMCMLYAYTRLLHIKLKAWDLFDIPLFIALSAVLHYATVYVKILVPIGFLIFGTVFLFLRFRKTFYETVTVGTIALGISIVLMLPATIVGYIASLALFLIEDETVTTIIFLSIVSIIQIVGVFILFRIKRLRSGVDPKGETATFEILLFFSVGCIFAMMIFYTKNATQSLYETVILIIALFGLLFILWWFKHIKYSYRKGVQQQNFKNLEDTIEEYELNFAENKMQVAAYAELVHYLNKSVTDCAYFTEIAAAKTGCAEACSANDIVQGMMEKLHLTNVKCSLQNIPHTGVGVIDAPIIQLFTAAEHQNLTVSAEISADVTNWFADGKLHKDDIRILLRYLCDNAVISARCLPNAKVRLELGETANKKPLIRIYDSGEQFDEVVLEKLGLEQVTSRASVGGSGIGLFTVFKILAKYGASFTLDEAPQIIGFTKFIEIAFDGRRSVLVRTLRQSAVAVLSARKDITVELIEEEVLRDGTNG